MPATYTKRIANVIVSPGHGGVIVEATIAPVRTGPDAHAGDVLYAWRMQFIVSLIAPVGALSTRRDTAAEAGAVAHRIKTQGPVAITTLGGRVLELGEFAVLWGLT